MHVARLLVVGIVAACFSGCLLAKTTCEDAGGTTGADGQCVELADAGSVDASSGGSSSSSSGDAGPTTCDPLTDDNCINAERGVFVKGGAPVGGDGSKLLPYPSIATALLARQGKQYLYVCAGSYPENVVIDDASVSIIGGLDCVNFARGGGATRVAPMDGVALTVSGSGAKVSLLDVSIEAAAGKVNGAAAKGSNGASSVAAFVSGGAQLTAQRAQFIAGAGAPGVDGEDQANAADGLAGGPGGATAGAGGASTCLVAGGRGGDGDSGIATSTHGAPPPAVGSNFGRRGCGNNEDATDGCIPGTDAPGAGGKGQGGVKGAAAPKGGSGAPDASGWNPGVRGDGNSGTAGGGGGGGGQDESGGVGGGGGAGGCGGAGGGGGGAGGASIAVLVRDASFTATTTTLATVAAGEGGKGGNGGKGGTGGTKGVGAGEGLSGGTGGGGGGGAGGNGGAAGVQAGIVSFGAGTVVWSGVTLGATQATLEGVTLSGAASTPGTAGAAGAAGASTAGGESNGAAGEPGNPGADAIVTALLVL